MKSHFICSILCHQGILGGVLALDENTLTFKTGKVTVDPKYRNFELSRSDIVSLSWKWVVFPVATFEMVSGEKHGFLIFNKWRFMKAYER